MSTRTLTRSQVRRVDQIAIEAWGIPGLVLMENAGRGVVDVLCQLGITGPVVIAVAKGNNGGDGLVIARHLDLRGYATKVLLACDPTELRGDAAANYRFLERTDVPIQRYDPRTGAELVLGASWLVDALLGTGGKGDPHGTVADMISVMNQSSARKLAVDIPSGLDCDSGHAGTPTFRADHTCTFVASKTGLERAEAGPHVGQLHVLDIGVPQKLVQQAVDAGPD